MHEIEARLDQLRGIETRPAQLPGTEAQLAQLREIKTRPAQMRSAHGNTDTFQNRVDESGLFDL